jgi:hypothetical protein
VEEGEIEKINKEEELKRLEKKKTINSPVVLKGS